MRGSHTYRFADLKIASDVALPHLLPTDQPADWHVVFTPASRIALTKPYAAWYRADGEPFAQFSLNSRFRVVDFTNGPQFQIDEQRRTIACRVQSGHRMDSATPFLVHQVLPLLLGEDRLALHASAVATPSGIVVLTGGSGVGKSTLACRLASRGFALVSDDLLIVDHRQRPPIAVPLELPIRLWPDALDVLTNGRVVPGFDPIGNQTEKRLVRAEQIGATFSNTPARLAAIFVLEQAVTFAPPTQLAHRNAVAALLAQTFSLAVDDLNRSGVMLDRIARVLERVAVWRLAVVRDFDLLDAAADEVISRTSRGS